jgi:threonine synthase
MWKAFDELERIGWVSPRRRPRMVSVQAEGCAPIVRAFNEGTEKAAMWEGARTVADGLRVPRAIGDFLILRAVRESGGTALAVSDTAMVDGMLTIGACEGVSAAPESGATWAALRILLERGEIKPQDSVVLLSTGGALKYLDALPPYR